MNDQLRRIQEQHDADDAERFTRYMVAGAVVIGIILGFILASIYHTHVSP